MQNFVFTEAAVHCMHYYYYGKACNIFYIRNSMVLLYFRTAKGEEQKISHEWQLKFQASWNLIFRIDRTEIIILLEAAF